MKISDLSIIFTSKLGKTLVFYSGPPLLLLNSFCAPVWQNEKPPSMKRQFLPHREFQMGNDLPATGIA